MVARLEKTRMVPLPEGQKCDDKSIRLGPVLALDGLKDGFAITASRSACISMMKLDKKEMKNTATMRK